MIAPQLEAGGGEQAFLPATIRVDGIELPAWPEPQPIEPLSAPVMALARFADFGAFHTPLIATVLAAEQDPRWRSVLVLQAPGSKEKAVFRGGCGTKVRKISEWNDPAASLVHARALMLAHHT